MNPARIVNIGFGLLSLLFGLVLRQVVLVVWDYFRLPIRDDFAFGIPEVIALVGGVALFFGLRAYKKAVDFSNEAVLELSKVTWPDKKETVFSAAIIIVLVGIASLILTGFDFVWGTLTQRILTF